MKIIADPGHRGAAQAYVAGEVLRSLPHLVKKIPGSGATSRRIAAICRYIKWNLMPPVVHLRILLSYCRRAYGVVLQAMRRRFQLVAGRRRGEGHHACVRRRVGWNIAANKMRNDKEASHTSKSA